MSADDYEIGRGKPPKAHRWRKGESGNPPGRPKAERKSVAELIEANLMKKTEILEGGKSRKVTKFEIILRQIQAQQLKKPSRRLWRIEMKYEAYARSKPIRRKPRKEGY